MATISATFSFSGAPGVEVFIRACELGAAPRTRMMIGSYAGTESQQFVEVYFAALYALRQLWLLGGGGITGTGGLLDQAGLLGKGGLIGKEGLLGTGAESANLAKRLRGLRFENDESTFLRDPLGARVKTVDRAGAGGKTISADLYITDEGIQLIVNQSGYGLFRRNLSTHSADSVVALFVALAQRRPNERRFARRILGTALRIGPLWINGHVTILNEGELALDLAKQAWDG